MLRFVVLVLFGLSLLQCCFCLHNFITHLSFAVYLLSIFYRGREYTLSVSLAHPITYYISHAFSLFSSLFVCLSFSCARSRSLPLPLPHLSLFANYLEYYVD